MVRVPLPASRRRQYVAPRGQPSMPLMPPGCLALTLRHYEESAPALRAFCLMYRIGVVPNDFLNIAINALGVP
jgi:hypothetical protein